VDVHADGLLAAVDQPPRRVPSRVQPDPRVPAHARRRGRAEPFRIRPIREAIRLAELFEGWVRDEPGWELSAPRPFSVVCFRREGSDADNQALLERVNASGEIFISHTVLDGQYVLRLAIGHESTTEADVQRAWDVLRSS
jgi:hypothetical protein